MLILYLNFTPLLIRTGCGYGCVHNFIWQRGKKQFFQIFDFAANLSRSGSFSKWKRFNCWLRLQFLRNLIHSTTNSWALVLMRSLDRRKPQRDTALIKRIAYHGLPSVHLERPLVPWQYWTYPRCLFWMNYHRERPVWQQRGLESYTVTKATIHNIKYIHMYTAKH